MVHTYSYPPQPTRIALALNVDRLDMKCPVRGAESSYMDVIPRDADLIDSAYATTTAPRLVIIPSVCK